jgi:site-specific DNA-adenine methylase
MNAVEQSKLELTPNEWQRADELAQVLAKNTDRNEFGKIVNYMRSVRDPQRVIKLLDRLPNANYNHSQRTKEYFARIRQAYARYLSQLPRERAVLVASWAFRLTTYYNTIRPSRNHRRW